MKLTGMTSLYLQIRQEEDTIYMQGWDSRNYPFKEFGRQVLEAQSCLVTDDYSVQLLCLVGSKEKIEEADKHIGNMKIENNFLKGEDSFELDVQQLESSTLEELIVLSLLLCLKNKRGIPSRQIVQLNDYVYALILAEEEDFEDRFSIIQGGICTWKRLESPILFGKQLMTTSFLMRSLKKRRLIGSIPNPETGKWFLLFEGGVKVYLNDEIPYRGEILSIQDIDQFTVNQLDEILNNPIYSYGKWYCPTEMMMEWHNMLLYALASLNISYDREKLESLYQEFLLFLETNICEVIEAEPIITKDKYFSVLLESIKNRRKYLRCKVESGVSKNMMFLLESRYFYLQDLYPLIALYYPEEVKKRLIVPMFENRKWNDLLKKLDADTDSEKGKAMERLGEYFLSTISGFQLTGRRIREEKEEIDLCFMNVSLDYDLWKFGPLLLVECKNRKEKLSVSVLRSLIQVIDSKGVFTLILFTKNGLTKTALKEVHDQALYGKYIINFNLTELKKINEKHLPREVLLKKWKELEESVQNNIEMLS